MLKESRGVLLPVAKEAYNFDSLSPSKAKSFQWRRNDLPSNYQDECLSIAVQAPNPIDPHAAGRGTLCGHDQSLRLLGRPLII